MPFAHAWPRGQLNVVASILVLAAVALPAAADPRAPIVYALDGRAASPAAGKTALKLAGTDKATQRIEFRYPGQSGTSVRAEKASVSVQKPVEPMADTSWTEAPQFTSVTRTFDASVTAGQIGPKALVATTALQPVAAAVPAALPQAAMTGFAETGMAIVYGDEFDGLETSNGEIFDQTALTAAHPSLPLPSFIQVSNPSTGKEVIVRVNDRGPFEDGASLQVSRQAARALGFDGAGQVELKMRLLGPAPAEIVAPRSEAKPPPRVVSAQTPPAGELLGGDELAGGNGLPVTLAAVAWPEPPAEWGVSPAPKTVSAAASGTHFVQLASFSDRNNAEALYRGLRADLPVEIVPARVNGADYYRVRVGPLDSRASAQDLRDRLNAEGRGDGRVVTAE